MPARKQLRQGETLTAFDPGDVLQDTEFCDCTFESCRWQGLHAQNCSFIDCRFVRCQLSGVVFSFCLMRDAVMENCAFRSIAWGGLTGRSAVAQPFAALTNCSFQYSDFSGLALAGFAFPPASSGNVCLTAARWPGRIFPARRWGARPLRGATCRRPTSAAPKPMPSTPPPTS